MRSRFTDPDRKPGFRHTRKQHEIMTKILEAMDKGEMLTPAKLKERLSYGPMVTIYAIFCSLDPLVAHGFLAPIRRTSRNEILRPTQRAYSFFRGKSIEIPGS